MGQGILEFAILGLGAGSVYALSALGIVLVYRGSGVVNFAASAVGLVGAFIFYTQRSSGTPIALCWAAALGFGAASGAIMHLSVMRPLRRAPALTRLIATLAVFTLVATWAAGHYGDSPRAVASLLPHSGVKVLGTTVGADRLVLFGIVVALAAVLSVAYRRTKFGLATTAVAESRVTLASQGISPDAIATANWVVGSVLAVTAGVLVVDVSGLSVQGLAILIVPALAAALLGGFRSFSLTVVGGLLIGVLESEVSWLQSYLTTHSHHIVNLDGWAESVPFALIVLVLMVRGRALPIRGDVTERAPEVGTGRVWPPRVVMAVGTVSLGSLVLSGSLLQALTTSAAVALVMLSLVVVTGLAGQVSLAQFALAGFGAWVCAQLVAGAGAPFPVAALAGIAATVPLGLAVGMPSLRARGVNLAVATLGLAVVIEAQIFNRASLTGGVSGLRIGSPHLFGVDIGPLRHPLAYALVSLAVLLGAGLMVATLRRGRVGRRLLAVRSNELAAASLGISVFEAKLYAFGLSAAIAAAGGILVLFQQQDAVFLPVFGALQSVFAVVFVVLGGIGFIGGAILGGLLAPGGFVPELLSHGAKSFRTSTTVQLIASAALLAVLWRRPNGIAEGLSATARRLRARVGRPAVAEPSALPTREVEAVRPATLELAGVGVTYGGLIALDAVDLVVRPGEIVGLIGPNGAGKTTLLDAITGFTRAHGRMTLNGADIGSQSPAKRARAGVGRSFQTLELFETMTVGENLRTASEPRDRRSYLVGLVRAGRTPLADAAVAAVREFGLEADLDRRPGELPQGRRRLVAIARAVAARPSVLLLDEPAAGLDDAETAELGHLLRGLARRWGMAIVLVEHDVSLVFNVCDRVAVLDQGRVLTQATPPEVRSDPRVVTAYLGADRTDDDARRQVTVRGLAPANGTDRVVVAEGLAAGYGDVEVVHHVDLELAPGEMVALLGPNGAGKTTLLKTLAGELAPLAGRVAVLGLRQEASLHSRARRGLAFVTEERQIVAALTCRDNLRLGKGAIPRAVDEFPELAALLGRRAGLMSGGEQQMLCLARALASDPQVLLIDELSFGLAPIITERLLTAIRRAADRGVAVLLVEQHPANALRVADRAIVLRGGRVKLEGAADDLLARLDEIERAYLSQDFSPPTHGGTGSTVRSAG